MGWKPSELFGHVKLDAVKTRLQTLGELLRARPRLTLAIAGIASITLIVAGLVLTLPRSSATAPEGAEQYTPPVVAEEVVPGDEADNAGADPAIAQEPPAQSSPEQHPAEPPAVASESVDSAPVNGVAPAEFATNPTNEYEPQQQPNPEPAPQLPEPPPGAGQFVFEPADPENGPIPAAPEPAPGMSLEPAGTERATPFPEAADYPSESQGVVSATETGTSPGSDGLQNAQSVGVASEFLEPEQPAGMAPGPSATPEPLPLADQPSAGTPAFDGDARQEVVTPQTLAGHEHEGASQGESESPAQVQEETVPDPGLSADGEIAPAEFTRPATNQAAVQPGREAVADNGGGQALPSQTADSFPQETGVPGSSQPVPPEQSFASQNPSPGALAPRAAPEQAAQDENIPGVASGPPEVPAQSPDLRQNDPAMPPQAPAAQPQDGHASTESEPTRRNPISPYGVEFPESAPPQVNPALSVRVQGPAEIQLGNPCAYQLVVSNSGSTSAEGVLLIARVSGPVTDIETDPPARHEGEYLVWELGTLESGTTKTITVELKPTGEGEIAVAARALVTADVASRTRVTQPRLTLVKVGPSQAERGERVRFLLTVANPGTGTARNVVIRDTMPEAFQHPAGTELEYEVGDLAPGESRDIPLEVVAVKAGTYTNTAIAIAEGGLKAEATATVVITEAALQVEKTGPDRRYLGDDITYVIRVRNTGTAPARGVTVVDILPPGLKLKTAPPGATVADDRRTLTWTAGVLPPGAERTYEVNCSAIRAGEQRNRVVVTASGGLKTEAECRTLVVAVPALLLEVVDTDDPLEVGATTTYEVRIVNQGTRPIEGLVVTVELPEGMEFVAADAPSGFRETEKGIVFDSVPPLAPRASVAFYVRIRGLTPGDKRVRVRVQTGPLAVPVIEEESTRVYDGG